MFFSADLTAERSFRPLLRDLAKTSAANCFIRDYPLVSTAGKEASFVIVAKDALNRSRITGGDEFKAQFLPISDEKGQFAIEAKDVTSVAIKDNGDGTYCAAYTAQSDAARLLAVTFGNDHIGGSPFHYPFVVQGRKAAQFLNSITSYTLATAKIGAGPSLVFLPPPRRHGTDAMQVFTCDGTRVCDIRLSDDMAPDCRVAVGSDGRIFRAARTEITVFSSGGAFLREWSWSADAKPDDNSSIWGLAVDTDANEVWLANVHTVLVFTCDGRLLNKKRVSEADIKALALGDRLACVFSTGDTLSHHRWDFFDRILIASPLHTLSAQTVHVPRIAITAITGSVHVAVDRFGRVVVSYAEATCTVLLLNGRSSAGSNLALTTIATWPTFGKVTGISVLTDGTVCVLTDHSVTSYR